MKYIYIVILIVIGLSSNGQVKSDIQKLPSSYVNIGLGVGMNYGFIGVKTVIGKKNTGLLIGLGVTPFGKVGYEFGFQISYKWMYMNIGYGVASVHKDDSGKVTVLNAYNFIIGSMISIGKQKRFFIDIGVGMLFGGDPYRINGFIIEETDGFTAVVGLGYRIGGENIKINNSINPTF